MCEIAEVLKYLTGFLTKEASPKVCGSKWQLHYQESRVDQCCEREPGKKKKSYSNGSFELPIVSTPDSLPHRSQAVEQEPVHQIPRAVLEKRWR